MQKHNREKYQMYDRQDMYYFHNTLNVLAFNTFKYFIQILVTLRWAEDPASSGIFHFSVPFL